MEKVDNDWQEKFYQLCCGFTGLYHQRARMMSEGKEERAKMFDEPIRVLADDIKQWILKNG